MNERLLKVYKSKIGGYEIPQIRLQGRWLEKQGFNAGMKIVVEERYGELVIRVLGIEEILYPKI